MLNTDASLSRDLNEDNSVCHLLNNFPLLTKCLFVSLVWQLKLEKYFYEAIRFTPSWFMMQFLQEAVDSLRFSNPLDIVAQVKEIVESIYCNICRMDYKIASASQQVEQKIILNKLLEFIMMLLRNYNTPNADDDFNKSKKKKTYLGFSLNAQLTLIHNCFAMFMSKPQFEIKDEQKIYKLMIEKEPERNNFSTKSYSPSVEESLTKINMALLNTLQNSVVNVKFRDFLYWVEVDLEDDSTEDEDLKMLNLQKSVGAKSSNLIELIDENSCFEHDVIKQLKTIAIKPKTLCEIASDATVGTVLDRIDSSPNKRVWLEELLSRRETLYFNTECLQTIIDNIELVQFNDLMRILNDHQLYGSMDKEDEAQMMEIFRLGGAQLKNKDELRDFISRLILAFGVDYSLCLDDSAFSSELTNYFNKLTESSLNEDAMWQLILLNPSPFYERLLENIADQDNTQIDIVLKILRLTKLVAVEFIKDIVLRNLEAGAESNKSTYHVFLAKVFSLLDRKEFIRDILMQNLAKSMESDKLQVVSMLLSTLHQISGKLKIDDLMLPLTFLIAQVLDKCRWDLMSFTSLREQIVETAIGVIQDLVKTILIKGSEQDKDWIVSKINECKAMTKFYFQKFLLEEGESIALFDKFLHPDGFDGASKNEITTFLCETIVRCTTKELKWLMANKLLQPFITDALLVVTVIVAKANQQGAVNCLHKCVSDYVKVLKVTE